MLPSDHELYRLFDRSPIGMYRSSADGMFQYANPALARLLGYSVEELRGINLNRDIYVEPGARERLIATCLPFGTVDGARVKWKTRDGRILTVQVHGHVVDTDHGKSFDASVLDVTELEAARAELEDTAKILELVVHQMPAMYWICDGELRILRTGGAVTEILGYSADMWLGKSMTDVRASEDISVDPLVMHRRALAGERITYSTEYRGKQFSVTLAPHRSADGVPAGVIGTALDVTAARQLERRMVDAQRAESLGVLAGGLAHDFNNLLVGVLGNADLALREVPPGAPGRAAIENIRTAGLRAAELTDQLLAYAGRGGAGTVEVQPATVIDELLRIMRPSLPPQLSVAVETFAPLAVRADPSQLRQVLLNLVTNARDAIGRNPGSLEVRARRVDHDGLPHVDDVVTAPAGKYVALEVSDTGPGMDAETRRHVFEPFFTTKAKGHGLGLPAVLGIVRAHGGGLRLETSPGDGTRFTVLWPEAEPDQRAATTGTSAARTVLVIDDEDLVRDVVARMVEDLGYAAVTAADGATGLDLVDRQVVDAVLVDLTMPRMNGADVIARLRERRPELPVILCSGYDRDKRGPVRADAYLPKPFRIDALERTLAKLLP